MRALTHFATSNSKKASTFSSINASMSSKIARVSSAASSAKAVCTVFDLERVTGVLRVRRFAVGAGVKLTGACVSSFFFLGRCNDFANQCVQAGDSSINCPHVRPSFSSVFLCLMDSTRPNSGSFFIMFVHGGLFITPTAGKTFCVDR